MLVDEANTRGSNVNRAPNYLMLGCTHEEFPSLDSAHVTLKYCAFFSPTSYNRKLARRASCRFASKEKQWKQVSEQNCDDCQKRWPDQQLLVGIASAAACIMRSAPVWEKDVICDNSLNPSAASRSLPQPMFLSVRSTRTYGQQSIKKLVLRSTTAKKIARCKCARLSRVAIRLIGCAESTFCTTGTRQTST